MLYSDFSEVCTYYSVKHLGHKYVMMPPIVANILHECSVKY